MEDVCIFIENGHEGHLQVWRGAGDAIEDTVFVCFTAGPTQCTRKVFNADGSGRDTLERGLVKAMAAAQDHREEIQ